VRAVTGAHGDGLRATRVAVLHTPARFSRDKGALYTPALFHFGGAIEQHKSLLPFFIAALVLAAT
jgi:hypothetical protein